MRPEPHNPRRVLSPPFGEEALSPIYYTISPDNPADSTGLGWDLSVPALHRLFDLTMGFAFLNRIAFFIFSFPFGEAHFDLDTTVFEIDLERYQGVPFLGHLPLQPHDFLSMQEELAGA